MITDSERELRLEETIRVLKSLGEAERQLDMHSWRKCDMVACVGGWIASDLWFNRRGLTSDAIGTPLYEGENSVAAITQFLGLTGAAVDYLFMPTSYPEHARRGEFCNPEVIYRFEKFVKDGKVPEV